MILRHIWRGDKQRRLTHQAELRHGASTTARDYQIGNLIGVVHTLDECALPYILCRMLRKECLHLLLVIFARLPDDLHRSLTLKREYPSFHHLVQGACTQRTTHNQQSRHISLEAVIFQCLGTLLALRSKAATQRIARHNDAVGTEETLHIVIRHTYTASLAREYLVRHTCVRVLLLNNRRHSHTLRRPQHRRAGIATKADNHICRKVADNTLRLAHATHHLPGHKQVVQIKTTLHTRNRQTNYIISQRWDLLHLHLALGTHKENLNPLLMLALESLGNSHSRIDMTPCTAA